VSKAEWTTNAIVMARLTAFKSGIRILRLGTDVLGCNRDISNVG
jgi:hypothetical protein